MILKSESIVYAPDGSGSFSYRTYKYDGPFDQLKGKWNKDFPFVLIGYDDEKGEAYYQTKIGSLIMPSIKRIDDESIAFGMEIATVRFYDKYPDTFIFLGVEYNKLCYASDDKEIYYKR